MVEHRVHCVHEIAHRTVHGVYGMLVGHGCLIPDKQVCKLPKPSKIAGDAEVASRITIEAAHWDFEATMSCATAIKKQCCYARRCNG